MWDSLRARAAAARETKGGIPALCKELSSRAQPIARVGSLVLQRYVLGTPIGRGGFGTAHRALDLWTGDTVVAKVSHPGRRRRQSGVIEASALRRLRIPGVVNLLDEGPAEDRYVLVTELVPGTPWPGTGEVDLPQRVADLLIILVRIHANDLIHGDLKPSNILVDAEGTVRVLDLGTASHRSRWGEGQMMGTPAYQAPELLRGGEVSPASDLYAVARLVQRHGEQAAQASQASPDEKTRDLSTSTSHREGPSSSPALLESVLAACLAEDPAERPQRARTLLDALRAEFSIQADGIDLPSWAISDPTLCLRTPNTILPLRDDLIRQLDLTGDRRPSAVAQAQDWLEMGLLRIDTDERRVVADIGRLRGLRAGEVWHRARGNGSLLGTANALSQSGHLLEAIAITTTAARQAKREDPEEARRALRRLLRLALRTNSIAALESVLFQLGMHGDDEHEDLRTLANAGLLALKRQPRACLALLDGAEMQADATSIRTLLRAFAGQSLSPEEHEQILEREARAATTAPDDRVGMLAAVAWLRYRQRRFAEAAALHREAASLHPTEIGRRSAQLDLAQAELDAGNASLAEGVARDALAALRVMRHHSLAVRAYYIHRCARYRDERHIVPEVHTHEEAYLLAGPFPAALIALGEAAIAWRLEDTERVKQLAHASVTYFATTSRSDAAALANALLATVAGTGHLEDPSLLVDWCHQPGVALQVAALLRKAGVEPPKRALATCFSALDTEDEGARREVLSLIECRAALDL